MSYQTQILPSGLRVVHQREASPVVYLGFAVRAGTRDEGRREYGLAHFIEHMLFKGTKLRSSTQIIERIEGVGGELNAYTSKEETIIYGVFPREYRHRALQLMADVVRHSRFPQEELVKEQTVVIDEIQSYEDSPSELIFDEFENMIYRGHPLGHNILGTEASVGRQSSESCKRFFSRHYRPEQMVVFSLGDYDISQLIEECNLYFTQCALPVLPEPPKPWQSVASPKRIVRRRDTSQAHVIMGGYALSMYDPRRLSVSVLANILGGSSMNSRLNLALRERHGLVYHVECSYTAYSDTGFLAIYFGCAKRNVARAVELVDQELRRLIEEPIQTRELEQIKRQLRGQLLVGNDQREHRFLSMGKSYLRHNYVESLEGVCARIDAITAQDLHCLAGELLRPESLYRLSYL